MSRILPHLIIKNDEVSVALNFIEKYPPIQGRHISEEEIIDKKKYRDELQRLKKVVYSFPVDITGAGMGAV